MIPTGFLLLSATIKLVIEYFSIIDNALAASASLVINFGFFEYNEVTSKENIFLNFSTALLMSPSVIIPSI